jgi:pyruvate dehydrogenase E2 component (dihydrolipoyllysine-residue acetyltransferase)
MRNNPGSEEFGNPAAVNGWGPGECERSKDIIRALSSGYFLLSSTKSISVLWLFYLIMEVRVPNLGEGAESGTVVSILVKEGDRITTGQTILELENEKAVAPIPSTTDGVVAKIRVKEGDKLSVGQVILTTSDGAAPAAEAKAAPARHEPRVRRDEPQGREEERDDSQHEEEPQESEQDQEPAESNLPVAAAPSIRKIARELGINLSKIRGSERGGRIVMADLRTYLQRLQRLASQPRAGGAALKPAQPSPVSIDFSKWGKVNTKPLPPLRKTIAERMTQNWTTIPHVTQFDEADITALMDLRKKYAPTYEKKGARLTLTSFALKVVVEALKKHPIFNASLDEAANQIVFKEYYHIGLAVDTEQGLIVPVLRDVDKKSIFDLSKEVNDLAEKARDRKIGLEELKGSTFTISNQGGIGGGHFTPIINKPDLAILGLGRGAVKPVVREGKIEPRTLLPIAVSYDHRLIDGGSAARFTTDLVKAFESFAEESLKI